MNPTLQLDRESYGCRYPVADLACSCAWPVVIVIPPAYCHHIANTDYVRGNISSSVDTAYRIQTLAGCPRNMERLSRLASPMTIFVCSWCGSSGLSELESSAAGRVRVILSQTERGHVRDWFTR
jgi:hypothetical protein